MNHFAFFGLDQPENRTGQGGFAGSAFSDQTENLPMTDFEIHIMDDLMVNQFSGQTARFPIAGAYMPDFQYQFFVHPVHRLLWGIASISWRV